MPDVHKIIIKNLRLRCLIGINPDELKEKQDVIINAEVWTDFSKAIKSDDLSDTINYWELNKSIIRLVEGSKFNLVETLADRIAGICIKEKNVWKARIIIEKPKALKSAESVGVELLREKQ